jgi:aryl-alcohol dehydrogenase-like predicted oxidoreductase
MITGVICYSPMQSGRLTDSFTADRVSSLAPDDWRRRAPEFTKPNLRRNLLLRDALRPIVKRHGTSVSAIALAWTLAWSGVSGAIVGARTPKQVDGWIGAASIELTSRDLDEIATAVRQIGPGIGPATAPARHEVAR